MNSLQCPYDYDDNYRCAFKTPKLEDSTLAMKYLELHWNCLHNDNDRLDLLELDCSACSYSTNPPMKAASVNIDRSVKQFEDDFTDCSLIMEDNETGELVADSPWKLYRAWKGFQVWDHPHFL